MAVTLTFDDKKLQRITEKVYSIAMTKVLRGQNPTIPIKEMKFLVSRYGIKKKEWYPIVKYLEAQGLAKYSLGSRFVLVKLSSQSLERIYLLRGKQHETSYILKLRSHKSASGLMRNKLRKLEL